MKWQKVGVTRGKLTKESPLLIWLRFFDVGTHPLTNPEQLMAAQGGTIDWMRFGLRGYERVS